MGPNSYLTSESIQLQYNYNYTHLHHISLSQGSIPSLPEAVIGVPVRVLIRMGLRLGFAVGVAGPVCSDGWELGTFVR